MANKNCHACRYSFMEPDDTELVCGHKGAGVAGVYTRIAADGLARDGTVHLALAHCGPERLKFEQHPLRNEDGSLK